MIVFFFLYNDFLHNNSYNINVGKHLSLQYIKEKENK